MYSCPLLLCLQTKEKPPVSRRSVVDDQGLELVDIFRRSAVNVEKRKELTSSKGVIFLKCTQKCTHENMG